jgi:hypothetical protein
VALLHAQRRSHGVHHRAVVASGAGSEQARVPLDEFTLWATKWPPAQGRTAGTAPTCRASCCRRGVPVEELDRTLEALRPS